MDAAIRNAVLRRPQLWPRVAWRVAHTLLAKRRAPAFAGPVCIPGVDPELALADERANAVLAWVRSSSVQQAAARLEDLLARRSLADDTYSCSQRLSHATYLRRLGGNPASSARSIARLRSDAARVADHPEFRLQNAWFNNHLLNNFRSLVLARSALADVIEIERIERAIGRLDSLLTRHMDTLFDGGRGPVLAEGSVSYELLILRHLFDIVVCGEGHGSFASAAREWLVTDAVGYVARFRWKDRWLLPAIGDLSPDWRHADIEDFLDGAFLGARTLYRAIWGERLDSLRVPALRNE